MPWRGTAAAMLALALARPCLADLHSNVTAATQAEVQALEVQVQHDHHRHDMRPLLGADVQWVASQVHAALLAGNHSVLHPPPAAGNGAAAVPGSCQPLLAAEPCSYVRTAPACQNKEQRINYMEMYYCSVVEKGRPELLAMLLLFVWLMLVFLALVLTADLYFAPAVANIARWMDLSEDVAGATLLAFGNGAPDFFTQVAAITYGENVDLLLALGEGVGAGIYVCCFCLACSLLAAKADPPTGVVVHVPRLPFLRDAVTYLAGLVMALLAVRDHVFTRPEAASMLLLYSMYVAAVLYGHRLVDMAHPSGGQRGDGVAGGDAEHNVLLGIMSDRSADGPELELMTAHASAMRHRPQAVEVEAGADASSPSPASPRLLKSSPAAAAASSPVPAGTGTSGPESPRAHGGEASLPPAEGVWRQLLTWVTQSVGRSARAAGCSGAGCAEETHAHAVGEAEAEQGPATWAWLQTLAVPVRLCLALTMADPKPGAPRVSPVHAMLIAVFMPPLLGMVLGVSLPASKTLTVVSVALRCLLVLACAARFPTRGIPGADSALVSGIAFVSGLAWMDLCADEVVAIFQSLGRILNFPEDLLGGTIMCWAASVGDLVGMLAVVRQGHVQMVVTSCFAGPIFQLLAGLGVGILIADTDAGTASAVTLDTELLVLFGFGVSMLVAAYILGVPLLYKCALTRRFAALIAALYVCFVVVYTTIGLQPVRGRR